VNNSVRLLAILITAITLCACDRAPSSAQSIPAQVAVTEMVINDVQTGNGMVATDHHQVTVHYTGWLYDANAAQFRGKQFDSSRGDDNNRPQPFSFYLGAGQVIPGWEKGIVGMKVGGRRTLIIPASLAYGERGAGRGLIPKNAALIFDVELLAVHD